MAEKNKDIVDRLRKMCPSARDRVEELYNHLLIEDAAKEIERLRGKIVELENAPTGWGPT
jgi:hypothetical protein